MTIPQLPTDGDTDWSDWALAIDAAVRTGVQPADLVGLARSADVQAQVQSAVAALLGGAPGALDTLNELAAALGDDANFAATVSAALAARASLVDGRVPDSQLPTRLQETDLRAAFVPGSVYEPDRTTVSTTKRLSVVLTADGTDIEDLIIESVA